MNAAPATIQFDQQDLFISGTGGYHTYRIPAIVTSKQGTVLAFCEGRKDSRSDTGKIDLLLKRSTDGGQTWSALQVVWADAGNVCGNPAPVVDQTTGEIWLLMTWNRGVDNERDIAAAQGADTRRVFVTSSRDDGLTWSAPREITAEVKKPYWRWYATGPVNGIQVTRGPHRGRLVIPANHSDHSDPAKHPSRAHVIYSDDHGHTWQLGGLEDEMTNESTVVERADGSLLHNMRSYHGKHSRAIATSQDGGATWSSVRLDPALVEPVCQASLLRFTWPEASRPGVLLFANPASTRRENLTVRLSYDDGATWPTQRTLYAGPAAYSCLVVLPHQRVGCLYECGRKSPYEKIVLARFPVSWVSNAHRLSLHWSQLPPLLDKLGFAGPFAGVSDDALIVAGGANFPKGMPWEGGRKVYHDSIFVLPRPDAQWRSDFKLPRPVGYGVSITTTQGILCAGGSNAQEHFQDVFWLRWYGGQIELQPLPPLPQPLANSCGALVGRTVYLAGGIAKPEATNALHNFWALDLAEVQLGWRELVPWPGPARMLAAAGAQGGSFYLFGGTDLTRNAQGEPVRHWLKDAYCFQPGLGWRRLADLPRVAAAAPSPAVNFGDQLLLISGDDGTLSSFEPKWAHPGFPKEVLAYDPHADRWSSAGESPLSRATVPAVNWHGYAVIPNGEVRPGRRTPEVWQLRLPTRSETTP